MDNKEQTTNETDNPLKRLVHTSIIDFAEWLLGATVVDVRTANIELPIDPAPIKADQLFWITIEGGSEVLFHIEFQGKSSHKPMRYRMLDYIVRLVDMERDVKIHSVVFYIGKGVGERDTGHHKIEGANDQITLSWNYDVIHLWKLIPEQLLELQRPGLLPLIGQTDIKNPEKIIPQVFERIKAVPNSERQHRLLTELLALLTDERMMEMVENLMEQEEWVLDTPFLRRMRRKAEDKRLQGLEEGREKGLEEGREEGREKGLEEGHEKGLDEGRTIERRQSILEIIKLQHNPVVTDYFQVEKELSNIWSNEKLTEIFRAAVMAEDFATFVRTLGEMIDDGNTSLDIAPQLS